MKEKGEKKFKQSYLKAPVEPFVLLMGLFQQQDYRVSQFPGYYYFLFFFCTENKKGRSKKYCINPHYFPLLRVSVQLHLHQKWWIFFWNYFFFLNTFKRSLLSTTCWFQCHLNGMYQNGKHQIGHIHGWQHTNLLKVHEQFLSFSVSNFHYYYCSDLAKTQVVHFISVNPVSQ